MKTTKTRNLSFLILFFFALPAMAGTWGDVVCRNPSAEIAPNLKGSVFARGIFHTQGLSLETLVQPRITFKTAPALNVSAEALNRDRNYTPSHEIYENHHRFTFVGSTCRFHLLLPWVVPIRYQKEGAHRFRGFLQTVCPNYVKAVSLGCDAL